MAPWQPVPSPPSNKPTMNIPYAADAVAAAGHKSQTLPIRSGVQIACRPATTAAAACCCCCCCRQAMPVRQPGMRALIQGHAATAAASAAAAAALLPCCLQAWHGEAACQCLHLSAQRRDVLPAALLALQVRLELLELGGGGGAGGNVLGDLDGPAGASREAGVSRCFCRGTLSQCVNTVRLAVCLQHRGGRQAAG